MLKSLGLKLLISGIKLLITKELLLQIKEAVLAAANLKISGPEKKAIVQKELADVYAELKKSAGGAASIIFNAAIDYVHLKVITLNEEL